MPTKERKSNKDLLNSTMSLGDHLEELRFRLIRTLAGLGVGVIIGLCLASKAIAFIKTPYANAMTAVMGEEVPLQIITVAGGFVSFVKIGLIAGLLFSSPWVFYQLWMFIAAGLYPNEKRYVYLAAPFSAALFVTGALFFILVVAPLTLKFLVGFNQKILDVKSQFTFQHYISFVSHLMLVFGLAFQTPAAIYFLNRTGLVSLKSLRRSRKYVILVIVIVAAMATPPDVVSQIALALPLYLLFEVGILLSYFASRRKTKDR